MSDFESKKVLVGPTAVELVSAADFIRTVVISSTATAIFAVGYDNQVTQADNFNVGSTPVELRLPAGHTLWGSRDTGTVTAMLFIGAV